ncbi:MAG TPA: DNA alkylation repair protein [Jiangellales bacterium]|nr:DNA alkylation repair protein [Jiangellales bacterium]
MPTADQQLVDDIRSALAAAADPAKAGSMQEYMKSTLAFHGVQKPTRLAVLRPVLSERFLPDRTTWEATIRVLWDGAAFREERYAAIDLARHRAYSAWATDRRSMDLYDHLIVTGAWWDYVDEIAIRLVGPTLRAQRAGVTPVILAWSRESNLWRRRAAVICQVGARDDTDTALLTACIRANAGDPDFFLRKAIGWALREHAKTNPDWVRTFVSTHRDVLSPLSVREATRHL